jgi:hypothetical protein
MGDMGSVSGNVTNTGGAFFGAQFGTMSVGGNLSNDTGSIVDVVGGGTLNIMGDVINAASTGGIAGLFTGYMGAGGNTLTIGGTLNNSGVFALFGGVFSSAAGDTGTIGSLINNSGAVVDVDGGSTLTITGDVTNSAAGMDQGIYTSLFFSTGGNTINIGGMLTNNGDFWLTGAGDRANIGSLINNGDIEIGNGSTLQVNGDVTNSFVIETGVMVSGGGNTVNITGTFTNQGNEGFGLFGAGDKAAIGGDLINSATVTIENGSTLQVNGTVDNTGLLGTNLFAHGGGNSITVNGLLTNEAAGTITLNGPGDVLSALAGLSNSGVINVNHGSSILPPFFNNLGTLNIDGTSRFVVGTPNPMGGQGYIQLANGTLGEMIASLGSFGVIDVKGSALLDGNLAILLQGGFNPAVGSTFKFLNFTPGDLSGTFANIENDIFNGGTEKWLVDYDNADGFVELIAEPNQVPEPATLLVLIPGLLGMGYGLRRKLLR